MQNPSEPILDYVDAPDGWRLATYRYPNRSPKKFPVILVHGLGTNRFDLDFPEPRLSLARYLNRRGYDCWLIEFRGTGKSRKNGFLRNCLSKLKTDWDFDDYIFKDLPVLVGHILKKTRKERLHWVGHSLGGTVIYAAIETLGNRVCASAVTLGSAMSASAKPGFVKLLLKTDPLVKRLPCLPAKHFARLGAPLGRWIVPLEDNFYYAIDNVDMKTMDIGMRNAVEDLSVKLFLQLHDWYKNNHFRSRDGTYSYRDNLRKIKAPFLICAGSVDGMTPYPDVHFAFREISSKDKKFQVFGRDHGCRTEYGHVDLILGKNAPREVFPAITEWFKSHDKK